MNYYQLRIRHLFSNFLRTEVHSEDVVKVESFLEARRENLFCVFLIASGGCWQSLACRPSTPVPASVAKWCCFMCICVSLCPFSLSAPVIGLRATLIQDELNLIASAKTPFSKKATFIGARGQDFSMYLQKRGTPIQTTVGMQRKYFTVEQVRRICSSIHYCGDKQQRFHGRAAGNLYFHLLWEKVIMI